MPTASGIVFPPCTRQKEIAEPTGKLISSSSPSSRVRSGRRSKEPSSSASTPLITASPRALKRISLPAGGLPPDPPPFSALFALDAGSLDEPPQPSRRRNNAAGNHHDKGF